MLNREITIPKALHELHGPSTRLSNLVLVYLAAAVAAAIFVWRVVPLALPLWKLILLALIILDIAGGVVANLSTSTNRYYQSQNRSVRVIFLALHLLQPLGLALIFPQHLPYFLFLPLFTLPVALSINALEDAEVQQNMAAFFFVIGLCGAAFFALDDPILYVLAPLYMAKLILGFSVARPSFLINRS